MPELPEVETIVRGLNKEIKNKKILDAWSDWTKAIKTPKNFNLFKKEIIGKTIKEIKRRGKNILFYLSNDKIMLIHQKLTGHLLVGKWKLKGKVWEPIENKKVLTERVNNYIHLMFYLSGNKMLALSDLRKFAKVLAGDKNEILNSEDIKTIGPEPLAKDFTFDVFKKRILLKPNGQIKYVLMDQAVIAGIGNIYSDEILWEAKIYPLKIIKNLKLEKLKRIYIAIKKILEKSIKYRGDSMSDFRDAFGKKGGYQEIQKVYQRTGETCKRCGAKIMRFKNKGRSGHYCPKCQK